MSAFSRACKGVAEQLRSQPGSLASIALALLCLAGALVALENASRFADRWSAPVRVTVYLADDARDAQIETLRAALSDLPEVSQARYVSPRDVRALLALGNDEGLLAGAPTDLFPATIELDLVSGRPSDEEVRRIGERVRRLPMVSDVETYHGLTERLREMLRAVRVLVVLMGLVAIVCALAVVGNTVRLSLHARLREIEVLRLVGATSRYIRAPFVIEGVMVGGGCAVTALVVLGISYALLHTKMHGMMGAALGIEPAFLSLGTAAGLVAVGGVVGATGSALAMRRWLRT